MSAHRFPSWRDRFPKVEPHRTAADKLLAGAFQAKIELLRFTDDDGACEAHCQYEITGTLNSPDDARELLGALLRTFNTPAAEGGGAHV